jgi:hypothetical protein
MQFGPDYWTSPDDKIDKMPPAARQQLLHCPDSLVASGTPLRRHAAAANVNSSAMGESMSME